MIFAHQFYDIDQIGEILYEVGLAPAVVFSTLTRNIVVKVRINRSQLRQILQAIVIEKDELNDRAIRVHEHHKSSEI
jgi:hypothetical protein